MCERDPALPRSKEQQGSSRLESSLTVSRKLYFSFGAVVVLLAGVIGVALYGMSRLDSAHRLVTGDALPKVVASDAARSAAGDMHLRPAHSETNAR